MQKIILFLWLLLITPYLFAQTIHDFYYVVPETNDLPVLIRGNLTSKKILIYVQGGSAENGIDFGRSDYPGWKKTLETKVAIAYFDQRGLNKKVKNIDTTQINANQVLKDIMLIAHSLKERYEAEIHLFGHSNGGVKVLKCLATYPKELAFISSGIVLNAPMTTDFSPERYNHYRPLYLKNVASEYIQQGKDTTFWKEAYHWMEQTDSIDSREDSKRWNAYVDRAYPATKRKIGVGMVLKTVFAKPYNPIKYLNNKDNKLIGDRLWYAEKARWDTHTQTTLWEMLPNIQHPVLLVTGRYDAIAVPEEQKEAHKLLKNAKLVIIPDCTHESFLDQPNQLYHTLITYLGLSQNSTDQ